MKKHLFLAAIAAVATFTGCSNEETLEQAKGEVIGFSKAFVNNITRADAGFGFQVWGFEFFKEGDATKMAQIMGDGTTGMPVDANGNYEDPRYWAENSTYVFGAAAPDDGSWTMDLLGSASSKFNGTSFTFTQPEENPGTVDFMTAATNELTYNGLGDDKKVTLTFEHVLSKVKFQITNDISPAYKIAISNLKITNSYKTGTMVWAALAENYTQLNEEIDETSDRNSINDGWDEDGAITWPGTNGDVEIDFGDISVNGKTYESEERYLIPDNVDTKISNDQTDAEEGKFNVDRYFRNRTYNVTFDMTITEGSGENTKTSTVQVKRQIKNPYFRFKTAYVVLITLTKTDLSGTGEDGDNGDYTDVEIKFDEKVEGWNGVDEENGGVDKNTSVIE